MVGDEHFARLLEEHRAALLQFVATELDLAITFCERALTEQRSAATKTAASSPQIIARNAANAKKAYGSAIRAMKRSEESIEGHSEIVARMDTLKPMLARLKKY